LARRFLSERSAAVVLQRIALEPAGDLAADLAVEAILGKTTQGSQSSEPQPSASPLDAARALLVDALRARPGSAVHRLLLGRLALQSEKALGQRLPPEAWSTALWLASGAAPGRGEAWIVQADAYLERWESLSQALRDRSARIFANAFDDPRFVSRNFVRADRALGREEALGLLPDRSEILREAARSLSWERDLEGAALLFDRLDRVRRRERVEALRHIEERRRLGDVEGLRAACLEWSRRYPVGEFDDPRGRSELSRVLELWPASLHGSWRRDPRAEMIRFFLDGRESAVAPATLLRAVESLTGVPEAVAARVRLLAGDPSGAEQLRRASGGSGPEWTGYLTSRARFELTRGRPKEARALLDRVSRLQRDACEVLLVRREVARDLRDEPEIQEVGRRLTELAASASDGLWTSNGTLTLCLDPERIGGKSIRLEIAADAPTVLAYGWDGGSLGTVLVSQRRLVHLSLAGLAGEKTLALRPLAGDARTRVRARWSGLGQKT
jgi:hypothetical protein